MAKKSKIRLRKRRLATILAMVLLLLVLVTTAVLRLRFNGPRLADMVEDLLEGSIRGRVKVSSIEWPLSDMSKLVTGGWLRVDIYGLEVWDEEGEQVIGSADDKGVRGHLEIDLHPAIGGKVFRLRNVHIEEGGEVLIRMLPEPYPAHEYDDQVVSLFSAFYPVKSPTYGRGIQATKGTKVDVLDFHADPLTLTIDQGEDFKAVVHELSGSGFLYFSGDDPLGKKLYYSLSPEGKENARASTAELEVTGKHFELSDIDIETVSQLPSRWPSELVPRDLKFIIDAKGPDGLAMHIDGATLDSWIDIFGGVYDLDVEVEKAGYLASTYLDGMAHGKDLSLQLRMEGPVLGPRLAAALQNLELTIPIGDKPPFELSIAESGAKWDLATESGSMEHTVAMAKTGGRIELEAKNFRLKPLNFDLQISIPDAIDVSPYLPEDAVGLAGSGRLEGTLKAHGTPEMQRLDELELRLGAARVSGTAYRNDSGMVIAESVDIKLAGTEIQHIKGSFDMEKDALDLGFRVVSTDAARWQRYFGMEPLVRGVTGRVHLGGATLAPTAKASLVATGLPIVNRVSTDLHYEDKSLAIRNARTTALGGWLRASGTLELEETPTLKAVRMDGAELNLGKLPVIGPLLSGKANVKLTAAGRVDRPALDATLGLVDWGIANEAYENSTIQYRGKRNGNSEFDATLKRKEGGELHVDAIIDRARNIAGALTLRSLPLDAMLAHGSEDGEASFGAVMSAELQVGGNLDAPTAQGSLSMARTWMQQAFWGNAELELEESGDGEIRITGHFFQRRISIEGLLSTRAPYRAELHLGLRRIEIDRFAPAMAEEMGLRGWVSGEIDYRGELGGSDKPLVFANLTEAEFVLDNEDAEGRPSPVRLRNEGPLRLSYDGETLQVIDSATFRGPTGPVVLSGQGSPENLGFGVEGKVAVGMLMPYFTDQFESMDGSLQVKARVAGSAEAPRLIGVIEIDKVRLKPAGQDTEVSVPSGKIDFTNDQLSLTGLRMVVKDEYSDEVSELSIAGGVRLANFSPQVWAMRIDGTLAGKMLLVVAPQLFSAARGSADISVALLGFGETPDIDGTIEFDADDPLAITPRDLQKEIAFTDGAVRFTDQEVELDEIAAIIDDDSYITRLHGVVDLVDWAPEQVDVVLDGRDMLFEIEDELELSLNLRGLEIVGGSEQGLEVNGLIEVADGRYIAKFNPYLDALRPVRSEESSPSVFETVPLLGNAKLDLSILSRAFFVDNNVAQLELNGEVEIKGTPLTPLIDGSIRVEDGNFKFQGMASKFERTTGTVGFSSYKEFPEESPILDIRSESEFRSTDGQDHLITLILSGPISQLNVDLSTNTGLNKGQTLALILTRRAPNDARELFGDGAVTRGPGDFDGTRTTASNDNNLAALDQLTKDIAGDFFSLVLGDQLQRITKLDVARLQLGTASFGFHGEKDVTRSLRFLTDFERSLNGWTWNLQGRYRLDDNISIEGEYLEKNFDDEAEEDTEQSRVLGTYRFLIP